MSQERQLSIFASEAEVIELLFNAIMQTGYGNDYIYDDINDCHIAVEDVRTIIKQLNEAKDLM